jgi:hypothetical protein
MVCDTSGRIPKVEPFFSCPQTRYRTCKKCKQAIHEDVAQLLLHVYIPTATGKQLKELLAQNVVNPDPAVVFKCSNIDCASKQTLKGTTTCTETVRCMRVRICVHVCVG